MSRSRKKTPITGITTADSDKAFKEAEHRRERRALRSAVEPLGWNFDLARDTEGS
ncbi:hypothetical protein [Brucella cytisi]|uniref:hypothetical protein n=1 Tax=Brucella cytisi TaxID=407152 RepID=UPI00142DF0F1|nr:hypothetical protein [Brucella cytisi]NKC52223.1 hypothetical protein [Brucella cytisi]